MFRIKFLFAALCVLLSSVLYSQEATLQVYPDLHFERINTIDASNDGENILTSDTQGKIIFWDLEESKPLRIWNVLGRVLDSKIILGDASAVTIIKKEDAITIKFFDLIEGNEYGTLEISSTSQLKAYSYGTQTQNKGSLYLLYNNEIVAINLYAKKIEWRKEIVGSNNSSDDISVFRDSIGDVIATRIDNEYAYFRAKDGADTSFSVPDLDFEEKNIFSGYHLAPAKNDSWEKLEVFDLFNREKIQLNAFQGYQPEHIVKILRNNQFTYIYVKSEGIEEKIFCYNNLGDEVWNEKVETKDISLNKFNYLIHTSPNRDIIILSGNTGHIIQTIKNEIRSSKKMEISPDFGSMIYSDLGDIDINIPEGERMTSSYLIDMYEGINIFPMDMPHAIDVDFSDPNLPLTLHDGNRLFDGEEIPPEEFMHLKDSSIQLSAIQFDTLSGYVLATYNSTDNENFVTIPFYNNDVDILHRDDKPVAALLFGHYIYGDIVKIDDEKSEIITPKNCIRILGTATEDESITLSSKGNKIKAEFIPGGRYVQYTDQTPGINQSFLYDIEDESHINPYTEAKITKIIADKKGERILLTYSDLTCVIASLPFRVEHQFKLTEIPISILFNESKNELIYKAYQQPTTLKILNYETNELSIINNIIWPKFEDISLDGNYLAMSNNISIGIIDLQEKKTIISAGNPFEQSVSFVRFSHDHKIALSANYNGRLKIWDLETGKLSATVVISNDVEEYVIYEEGGLFDASSGAMEDIYYVVRKEIVEFSQLKDDYWEPDLLQMNLKGDLDDSTEEEISEFKNVSLYPDVELSTDKNQEILTIKLTPNMGGIGPVAFYINGVEIEEDINIYRDTEIKLYISDFEDYLIVDRFNILGVKVSNSDSTLISREKKIPITYGKEKFAGWGQEENILPVRDVVSDSQPPVGSGNVGSTSPTVGGHGIKDPEWNNAQGKGGLDEMLKFAASHQLDTRKTRLIGLVVGTSDYIDLPSKSIDLSYADNDAITFSNALKAIGKPLFQEDNKIIIHTLTSDASDTLKQSSRTNILAKMEKIKGEVKVDDILIIFFSGHGVTHKDKYYYATMEATDNTINGKGELIDTATISADEIKNFIKGTKSLRKLLILDACYSGAFNPNAIAKSGESTQKKAMDKLKDKTGMYILSSSTGEQESYELKNLKQGLLTYSLMDGMSGKAANENVIDVLRLISFVEDEVPKVAEKNKIKQQPVFFSPEASSSFTLGIPDERLRPIDAAIRIGKTSVSDTAFVDPKELSQKFDEKIKTESLQQEKSTFQYVAEASNDFIFLKGMYTVDESGEIHLKGSFRLHNKVVKKVNVRSFTDEGIVNKLFSILEVIVKKE